MLVGRQLYRLMMAQQMGHGHANAMFIYIHLSIYILYTVYSKWSRAQDPSLADDLCPSLAKLATLNLSSGARLYTAQSASQLGSTRHESS